MLNKPYYTILILWFSRDEGSTIDKTYIREFMSNPNQMCCTEF
jgi:hypothetical protein